MGKKFIANCVFALLYVLSVFFFCQAENVYRECIVFLMSHIFLLGALLFRRKDVTKSEICRSFVICIMLITALTLLPISSLWTLVPFWVVGYAHASKVSYDRITGNDHKSKVSEKEKSKYITFTWVSICLLISIMMIFS